MPLPVRQLDRRQPAGRVATFDELVSDSRFDQLDLVLALQSGKYMTGQPAEFSEGDWNSDGSFDRLDVVFALQSGSYLA